MSDFRSELKRLPNGIHFETIPAGDFKLSIQASEAAYSSPRETLPNGTDYTNFELAIFLAEADGIRERWVNPQEDLILSNFPWASEFEEGDNPVAGWMPVEAIEQIRADLFLISKKWNHQHKEEK
jgi:hypothetical protein